MDNTPHPQSTTARREAVKSFAAPSMSYMKSDNNDTSSSFDPYQIQTSMYVPFIKFSQDNGNNNMEEDESKEVKNHLKILLLLLFNHLKIIIV